MKQEASELSGQAFKRAAIYLAAMLLALAMRRDPLITGWLFLHQDAAAGIFLLLLWLFVWRLSPKLREPLAAPSLALVAAVALVLVLALWGGAHAVMLDYPLTRDELMANFDAANFAAGRLAAPLPAQWAGYGLALVPDFLLEVPGQALLVSGYMPVNAAMRALFGMVADPALLNPLLAAGGLLCLHRIARCLFADCAAAHWLVLAGYLLSAQIAANAMTAYAMTAHLAFNLVWLALFLRNRWWSHALAMIVGALAIGLHQVVFHPLFAGPFILWLLVERRWRLFAVYAAAYLGALGFWISWPHVVLVSGGVSAQGVSTARGGGFIATRVMPLLLKNHAADVPLMFYNLVRGSVWNAAFVLPFALMAMPAIRRRDRAALPLAAGVMLTIVAMTVLLAYQGHGWGYRYIHGVLGNCLLLAGYGYRELARRDARVASGAAAVLAAGTVPMMVWLLATAHGFIAPYARLSAMINGPDSDFAIVDSNPPGFAVDQVRNRPDLGNRPLILSSRDLSPAQLDTLCARGSIVLVTRRELRAADPLLRQEPLDDPKFDRQTALLRGRACVRPVGG